MWFGVSHTQLTVLNGCLDPLQIISCLLKVMMNSNTTDQERLLPHPEEIKEKTCENTLQNCVSTSNMVNAYNAVNLMRIKLNFKACPFWMASEISGSAEIFPGSRSCLANPSGHDLLRFLSLWFSILGGPASYTFIYSLDPRVGFSGF